MGIKKIVIIGLMVIILFWLIDYRLKEIEKIRCEVWKWEVCKEGGE